MDGAQTSKEPALRTEHPGPGWLPARVVSRPDGLVIEWAKFGRRRLTEPFFEASLAGAVGHRFSELAGSATRLADLPAMTLPRHLTPSGLIFHMSRCGSTLVSQMLAASAANIVVSEAPPIDAVVRLDAPAAERAALLQAMAAALGQVRRDGETGYVIKLDSWHTRFLPLFRSAFPSTPWVFVYRDPAEVMISHVRRAGMQMIPTLVAPEVFGLEPTGQTWGEDYYARVLAAICEGALEGHAGGGGLLVNYDELPDAVSSRILPHFGLAARPEDLEAMVGVSAYDAKSPGQRFAPDAEAKRQAMTPTTLAPVQHHCADVYRRLEAERAR